MSAWEAIHERIHGPGYCEPPCGLCQEVADLLDAYAHELAEKQRAFIDTALKMSPWATGRDGRPLRIDAIIDLIDPEVGAGG